MKEKIEMDYLSIKSDSIHISGSCTSFCYKELLPYHSIDELLKEYDNIKADAREAGMIISTRNAVKGKLIALKPLYRKAYRAYSSDFERLVSGWKNKMETGIFVGYSDDEEIQSLFNLNNDIDKTHLKNGVVGQLQKLIHIMTEAKSNIGQYNKIFL